MLLLLLLTVLALLWVLRLLGVATVLVVLVRLLIPACPVRAACESWLQIRADALTLQLHEKRNNTRRKE